MIHAIPQGHSDDSRHADGVPLRLFAIVDKVCRDVDKARAPSIKAKDFIRKVDDFPALGVREFLHAAGTRALRDVLGTKLLVEFRLQRCDLLGRCLGYFLRHEGALCTESVGCECLGSVHTGVEGHGPGIRERHGFGSVERVQEMSTKSACHRAFRNPIWQTSRHCRVRHNDRYTARTTITSLQIIDQQQIEPFQTFSRSIRTTGQWMRSRDVRDKRSRYL